MLRELTEITHREPWIKESAGFDCACLVLLPLRTDDGPSESLVLCDAEPDAFGDVEVEVLAAGASTLGSLIPPAQDTVRG